jgi:hypothetical protein
MRRIEKRPVCAVCGKPIEPGRFITKDKKNYHESCFLEKAALKCDVCGKIIQGKYRRDYWGNRYHADHVKKHPQCFYCSRLISRELTGGGKQYPDGRKICALCLENAVSSPDQADRLVHRVREELGEHGIELPDKLSKVTLVDRRGLVRAGGKTKRRSEEQGNARLEKQTVNGRLTSFSIDVTILSGLPEIHFIATAAHELMHVWQYLYAVPENDLALREGACNYAAFLLLSDRAASGRDGDTAEYVIKTMFENKDKIYGKGFHKVYGFAKRNGTRGLLEYLKKSKRLP